MFLWKPVTAGEELFLRLHQEVGSHVTVTAPADVGTEFLVDHEQFAEFARLAATTELFLRCLRAAAEVYGRQPSAAPHTYALCASHHLSLPGRLLGSTVFAELLRNTGRIAVEQRRNDQVERNATQGEPGQCYSCGIAFGPAVDRTIEHLWPLSMGGETVDGNLVVACAKCNNARGNTLTWASGPVQQTYYVRKANGRPAPPRDLAVALKLARKIAVGSHVRSELAGKSLKQIVQSLRPLLRSMQLDLGRPYVYFELHHLVRNAA